MSDDGLVAAALERVMERLDQIEARLDAPAPTVAEDDGWPDWNEDPGSAVADTPASLEPAPKPPAVAYRPPSSGTEWIPGQDRTPVSDSPVQEEMSSGHSLTALQIQMAMDREWLGPRKRFDQGRIPAAEDRV